MRLQGYRAAPRPLAAQNFTMPAMSPTMTEGNITSWKVKEGPGSASMLPRQVGADRIHRRLLRGR